MAITNIAYPSGEPTVQDALWHTFSSNNVAASDFKYVFDIYVGGTQQVRVKLFAEPANNIGYFDAAPTVRNTFTYQWFTPVSAVYAAQPNASGQIAQTYQYRIGEEYSGVTYLNLASGNVTAYNWQAPLFKRFVEDSTSKLNKWFTNRPATINAGLGENLFIPFKTNTAITFKVDTYNYSNVLINNYVDSSGLTTAAGYVQCNIGSAAINALFGSSVVNDGVKYYDVWFNSFDKIRVYLKCNPKYDAYNLHFINAWGMYDSARFDLVSKLSMDIERKTFMQRDYSFGAGGVSYETDNVYNESKVNYLNKKDFTQKLTMNAPSDDEWQWLAELVTSPKIFFEKDGYFYPVTIKATNYEFKKYVNNRLQVFEVELELSQTRYSHLR